MDTIIRDARPNDIPFIYSTWLKAYYCDSTLGKSCRKSVFFDNYKQVIDEILQRPTCRVAAVCDAVESDVIYSYLVCEPGTIHFAYTKEVFRRMGLVRRMVGGMSDDHNPQFVKGTPPPQQLGAVPGPGGANSERSPNEMTPIRVICTHKTFGSSKIFDKYANLLVYNPFDLYRGVKNEQSSR